VSERLNQIEVNTKQSEDYNIHLHFELKMISILLAYKTSNFIESVAQIYQYL